MGEHGSGRTSRARALLGHGDHIVVDGIDAGRRSDFARRVDAAFDRAALSSAGLLIENVHLLGESEVVRLAEHLRRTRLRVVLTAVPGPDWDCVYGVYTPVLGHLEDIPPLRSRRDEIPRIAATMLGETPHGTSRRFSPAALRCLTGQMWTGNLAELRRVVEAAADQRTTGDVTPDDLPSRYRHNHRPLPPREEAERETILRALRHTGGNQTKAARELGVSRSTLYNRMQSLGIGTGV
ncbi:helix-turn-helix domain-containing protein [Gordonia sp. NB41Y]|uniref:helix-turn-helix domain-containing protein n=1 Tax=Gordonia sp. NB41Y TaxID=875808 RepID=UPI0002BF04E6|nr:helix-turn-helix domain-containing protein [Gordonia sp. NB41Y]EMP13920.1 hypothetical protein ISGA_211 [Gordonia sp. NB41Y]WLP88679.1 helix-turn-helix domain-containing protein [Gordonia sp. NB41Y]